jgi:RNA ligase (TIGR02306 family)
LGLLFKAPEDAVKGTNVIEQYGIIRYEPSANKLNQDTEDDEEPSIPGIHKIPHYDLENYKKYSNIIKEGEEVFYTTKIHGTNARYVFWNGKMYCGSRTRWKKNPNDINNETAKNQWWDALKFNPWIEKWCKANPGIVIYGEIFGSIIQGNFHYGYKNGQIGFRVFDVWKNNQWVSFSELITDDLYKELKFVPILYHGQHNKNILEKLAEETETSLPNCGNNHIREGIVIKLSKERWDENIGRVTLKYISKNYLMKS